MLYSELAKTYRKLFKKYPNISSLQDFGGKILEEKTTYDTGNNYYIGHTLSVGCTVDTSDLVLASPNITPSSSRTSPIA